MHIIEAIILGLIQGITEYLPVSSSGHLLLIPPFFEKIFSKLDFNFQTTDFDVILHIATFLAILISYKKEIKKIFSNIHNKKNQNLIKNLFLSTIPITIAGGIVFLTGILEVQNQKIASIFLIIIGILFILIDLQDMRIIKIKNYKLGNTKYFDIKNMQALKIGIFQSFAIIKGVSRSGISLFGSLLQGMDRKNALDYAFLISIPVFFILTGVEIIKLFINKSPFLSYPLESFIGFIIAFISSLIIINLLKKYIHKQGMLLFFGIYRVILGIILIFVLSN